MPHTIHRSILVASLFAAFAFVSAGKGWAQITAAGDAPAAAEKMPDKPRADRKPVETMMFTIDEFNEIQGRLAGAGNGKDKTDTAIETADLYLSTILYSSPKDWTIWVNGVAISPNQDFQTFQVTSITPTYVELLVPLSAQGMRPVRLGPNQTFIAKTGDVIEGHLH